MGNRFKRKKTLRFKKAKSEEHRAESKEQQQKMTNNNEQKAENNKEGNGHIWCNHSEGYISFDVCIIRQTRTPGNCKGCGHFKGAA